MATATATDLTVRAGLPFARTVRIVAGKNIWSTIGAFEVRSQIREGASQTSALVADLTPFLTATFDTDDIVIVLSMTGAETLTLGGGKYDMIVSDIGTVDAHGIQALFGRVNVIPIVTAPADA